MNNLEKDFVPYSESMELKELGFDEPCMKQWTYAPELIFCTNGWGHPKLKTNKESYSDSEGDCISGPTFSQVFRWFRENYLNGEVFSQKRPKDNFMYAFRISGTDMMEDGFNTYEEAELACLRKLIEIAKLK